MRLAITLLWLAAILPAQALEIRILSSRADMVTGGDALLEISGASPGSLSVKVNGADVTAAFRSRGDSNALIGRVTGLDLGKNVVKAKAKGGSAKIELVNHPHTGPVFSGPHQHPFVCETESAGLGAPLDDDCSIETRIAYYYRSTEEPGAGSRADGQRRIPRGFKPFDPSAPRPSDIAQATTTGGLTMDFVVRVETGTINRAIYQFAFLHNPSEPLPDPWSPNESWNGRLVYRFGGGCRAGYRQGRSGSALDARALSQGYAVAGSSLNVFGNNCDDVISAETMMMVKEHIVESIGPPVHTIGVGGSGGSMQQHLIAQNYPGLLDGIVPGASYPDPITLLAPVSDCSLLARAFDNSQHNWTDDQKKAVSGFATWKSCGSWMRTFSPGFIRPNNCAPAVPEDQVYDRELRPKGVRCGFHDNIVNVVGRDPETGVARRTVDNVGVQYGLTALNDGRITAEQFLELNETVGGYDTDANLVPQRSMADPEALEIAYRTGRVNSGGGSLGSIPIIDTRRYLDPSGNIHDRVRTFTMEERLKAANGSAANRVALTNAGPDVNVVRLMDQWLDAIGKDESGGGPIDTIARNKPAALTDACWSAEGEKIAETASFDGAGRCNQIYRASADPRIAAGAPLANDILKCELKPVDPGDYRQSLSADQLARLKAAFPDGVCDYSRPGVGQQPLAGTWLKY